MKNNKKLKNIKKFKNFLVKGVVKYDKVGIL